VQPIDPTGFLFTRKGELWNARAVNAAWRRVLLSRNAPLLDVPRVGGCG